MIDYCQNLECLKFDFRMRNYNSVLCFSHLNKNKTKFSYIIFKINFFCGRNFEARRWIFTGHLFVCLKDTATVQPIYIFSFIISRYSQRKGIWGERTEVRSSEKRGFFLERWAEWLPTGGAGDGRAPWLPAQVIWFQGGKKTIMWVGRGLMEIQCGYG